MRPYLQSHSLPLRYPQHASSVGASESSASTYVSMTEYTLSAASQVNADWNATSGLAQILNKPTKLTQFTNDLTGSSAGWNVPGIFTVTGLATASDGISVAGSKVVNFGSDVTKATNAGAVGYQIASGALDIFGAGATVGSRSAKIWDSVNVPGAVTSNSITTSNAAINGVLAVTGTVSTYNMVSSAKLCNESFWAPGGGPTNTSFPLYTTIGFTTNSGAYFTLQQDYGVGSSYGSSANGSLLLNQGVFNLRYDFANCNIPFKMLQSVITN